jgi:tRNA (Thr-GGU) A37 N-methylase
VRVTAIDLPTKIRVAALDAIDGTPILDLKIAVDPAKREAFDGPAAVLCDRCPE